jgi:hypothetical protein
LAVASSKTFIEKELTVASNAPRYLRGEDRGVDGDGRGEGDKIRWW